TVMNNVDGILVGINVQGNVQGNNNTINMQMTDFNLTALVNGDNRSAVALGGTASGGDSDASGIENGSNTASNLAQGVNFIGKNNVFSALLVTVNAQASVLGNNQVATGIGGTAPEGSSTANGQVNGSGDTENNVVGLLSKASNTFDITNS